MKPAPQHRYNTKTRGLKPASQLQCNNQDAARSPRPYISTVPRCEGQSSRPSCIVITKTQSLKPASGRVRNPRLARFGVSSWNARLEARVPTTEKLWVITALLAGSITAHVMRRVNPHYGGFLGDNFTPETPINSSVCYWRRKKISAKEYS